MHNFRRAARITCVFLAVILVLSLLFTELYVRGENFDYQDARERDALAGKLTVLVCGSSYPLFGVDPGVVNEQLGVSCYNLSSKFITVKGRRALLEQELARNPVHTVLLEVNPDTLLRDRAEEGPEGDLPLLGRLGSTRQRLEYLTGAFSLPELPMVYYDVVSKGIEAGVRLLRGEYRTENTDMRLGFHPNPKQDRELSSDYRAMYHLRSLPERIDPQTVAELEELIALVLENGARPILFTMPQSKLYNCMYDNLDFFHNWYVGFAAEHNVSYLNFNLARDKVEVLPDDACYYDETHLNADGAELFSRMLASALLKLYNGKDFAWEFYASYKDLDYDQQYFGESAFERSLP